MSGINATRDVLKDQLVLAADAIIELRAARLIALDSLTATRDWFAEQMLTPWQRLVRWWKA